MSIDGNTVSSTSGNINITPVTGSKIVLDGTINVDGRYEDCEHRAFHIQARQNSGARIMISPEVLFY